MAMEATLDMAGADVAGRDPHLVAARIERLPISSWHTKMRFTVGSALFFDAYDVLTIAFVLPVLVPGMTFIPGTTTANQEVNGQWTPAAIAPTAFGLGWIVFSGPSISLWYDDAAIGTTRIGCN